MSESSPDTNVSVQEAKGQFWNKFKQTLEQIIIDIQKIDEFNQLTSKSAGEFQNSNGDANIEVITLIEELIKNYLKSRLGVRPQEYPSEAVIAGKKKIFSNFTEADIQISNEVNCLAEDRYLQIPNRKYLKWPGNEVDDECCTLLDRLKNKFKDITNSNIDKYFLGPSTSVEPS